MTRNEQIEAMIEAFRDFYDIPRDGHSFDAMVNALDAADVEGMVRRAVSEGIDLGWDACETRMPEDEFLEKRDEIVRRVCG